MKPDEHSNLPSQPRSELAPGSRPMPNDSRFSGVKYDIEHALSIYAESFCTIPVESIYEPDVLAPLKSVTDSCHIYLIGHTPLIEPIDVKESNGTLALTFNVSGNEHSVSYKLREDWSLKENDGTLYLEDGSGRRFWPNQDEMLQRLSTESKAVTFDVGYVGQAYGKDGSRNAIDRLLKHETLQKISLKDARDGQRLSLLLLAIQTNNRLSLCINPHAKNTKDGPQRITSGLDKLFNTTDQERVALYEASLIRYFQPEFNKEFKDSFPSTQLKILQDCYEKDFSAVVAEICIDELPFRLCSKQVEPAQYHIAQHNLHKDEDRKAFFAIQ